MRLPCLYFSERVETLKKKHFHILKVVVVILFWCCIGGRTAVGQISVVANKSVPVDTLEQAELYQLFSGGREYWSSEMRVVIVDLAQKGEVRDSFYNFLGKTSSRMRSIWLRRKLTGEGELPISVENEMLLLKTVAETPGAIGFLSEASAESDGDVKVLMRTIPLVDE